MLGSAVPAGAAVPNTDPFVPPSVVVPTPSSDDCARRERPAPPVDTSEDLPPGVTAPDPLPVPARPVGGEALGGCGSVLPADAPALPTDITAQAWLIADLDTGQVLAAKDPHGRYRPASTLKLLTAQVMLRNLTNLDQVVEGTVTDTAQDGTRVGIEPGGQYTVRQLMTYLVIISGNDAANALARANGGFDKTIADMNATAAALGALDTRAATVSGLDGAGQSVSAYDLALFARADMATPPFPEIVSSVDVRVPAAGGEGYIAANDNQLTLQYPGALGGKTGFTDDAGNTFVGMAERDGRRLVVTMLAGTQQPRRQWMQAASLLDWGFALPTTVPPVGVLVNSAAEATAAPTTPSTAPPATTASPTAADDSKSAGAAATQTVTGTEPTDARSSADSSPSTAGALRVVIILGVVLLLLGALIWWLAHRRSRRPGDGTAASAGDGGGGADPGGHRGHDQNPDGPGGGPADSGGTSDGGGGGSDAGGTGDSGGGGGDGGGGGGGD
ncbi:hypothetical protein GCM10009818_13800 [Nakamurella flavida]